MMLGGRELRGSYTLNGDTLTMDLTGDAPQNHPFPTGTTIWLRGDSQ